MRKVFKMSLAILFILILLIALSVFILFQQPQFGKAPSGQRLEMIRQLPNYKSGEFQNISHTPQLAEGNSMIKVFWDFLFSKAANTYPGRPIPSVKTDLSTLPPEENVLVWMGHSSYFIQLEGVRYLIDPVLTGYASPVSFYVNAFDGSDIYRPEDIPEIDILIITHDHYDHLDYHTVKSLIPKVKKVVCPWGVGEHLEYWGYSTEKIIERNWHETVVVNDITSLHVTPARHFSGRTLKRNNTLWASYVLQTNTHKIFIGGDSGYDTHFKKIGEKYGPFDWVILENGQYNEKWKYIHALPSDILQIVQDLNAKNTLTVHHGKFKLADHEWNEPLKEVQKNFTENNIPFSTPMIGEILYLDSVHQKTSPWWED